MLTWDQDGGLRTKQPTNIQPLESLMAKHVRGTFLFSCLLRKWRDVFVRECLFQIPLFNSPREHKLHVAGKKRGTTGLE